MKALIIGLGSIGKRHASNLAKLGVEIVGYDPDVVRREDFLRIIPAAFIITEADAVFDVDCEMAVVASPNRFHLEQCIAAANSGMHLLVEKPLATTTKNLTPLFELIKIKKLQLLMGSNWKFHPGPKKLKEIVDSGAIGRLLAVQAVAGQYLPDWHPWEDYRHMYSARRDLGGGILLDSHEIDLLTWLLGPVKKVNCNLLTTGSIEIETEDLACMNLEFSSGILGTLQLDYLQHPCARRIHLTGSNGIAIWDYNEHIVSCYSYSEKVWRRWPNPLGYDLNSMYLDEAKHFLSCIAAGDTVETPLHQAAHVLAVIDAAKLSAAAAGATMEPIL